MTKQVPTSDRFFKMLSAMDVRDFREHRVVIFHHDDMDGAVAAASAYQAIKEHVFDTEHQVHKDELFSNLKFIPVNYDRQSDKQFLGYVDSNTSIFVLDFAFTAELTEAMIDRAIFFQTLDHHETSERMLGNSEFTYFDMHSSGALMAFQYFFPEVSDSNLAVTLADNRDLWKKDHGDEDAFHEAMMVIRNRATSDRQFIENLAEIVFDKSLTDKMIEFGRPMIEKRNSNIRTATSVRNRIEVDFAGYKAVFFNYSVDQSDACEFLYTQPEYSHCIVGTFKFLSNGLVNFSLRKGKYCDANLAKIAEYNFGGGGHEKAAGFHCNYERAISVLSNKEKWAMCWLTEEVDKILDNNLQEKDKLTHLLTLEPFMLSRAVCETDERFLQVLPYITVHDGKGNYLSYERPVSGCEKRLHGLKSVGFGGHIDQLPNTSNIYIHLADEAARELEEELGIPNDLLTHNQIFNFLSDNCFKIIRVKDTATETVHLGILINFWTIPEGIKAKPEEITGLQWESLTELNKQVSNSPSDFECWSRIAIKELNGVQKSKGNRNFIINYD